MQKTKQRIAVVGMARTGTTLMAASLNQVPGVRMCRHEIFNPNLDNRRLDCIAEGLPHPPADGEDILARSQWFNEQALPQLESECKTHYGYKIVDATLQRQPDIFALALTDPSLKLVVMSRNPMASFISNCVCVEDNVWDRELADGPISSPRPVLNMERTNAWVQRTVAFWQMITTMPCQKAIVTYSELVQDRLATMIDVCEWLGTTWLPSPSPLSRTRIEMVKDRLPDMSQVWPIVPAFWARDMYEILAEEAHLTKGPHI